MRDTPTTFTTVTYAFAKHHDVCTQPVEKVAIMGDNHCAAGVLLESFLQRPQRVNICIGMQ